MRTMWRPWGLAGLLLASLILTSSALVADPGAAVRVNAVVKDGAVRLEVRADAPFEYTTYRLANNVVVIDMIGVSTTDQGVARVLESDLVSSYRLLPFHAAGDKPAVRLEILLHTPMDPKVERVNPQELLLVVARPGAATSASPASPAPAKPAMAAAAPRTPQTIVAIEKIQLSLAENGAQTEVHVTANGHLNYHPLRLSQPERLVLDFPGVRLETPAKPVTSPVAPVRDVRAAQFTPEVARVVIDLDKPVPYHITANGNQVTAAFAHADAAPASRKPETKPTSPKTSIRPETEHRASVSKPAQPQSNSLRETAQATVLPASLTQTSAAFASLASFKTEPSAAKTDPAPAVPAKSEPPATVPAITEQAQAPAQMAGGNAAASAPSPQPAAEVHQQPSGNAPAPVGKYSGDPISVNLKDADLKDFFRLIHEISGLNVVVDPTVKGTLTIVLDEVPWDQALEIVLKNNDLDKQLEGNVLRIATKATLKREAEQNRDLAKAQAEAIELITTTRVLSYAKASELKDTIKKFVSVRGEVLSDERSNTLIIRDVPSSIPVVDNLLRQLDRKSPQVEIEARVVSANRSFARDIGSQFGFSTATPNGRNIFGGALGASPLFRSSPPLPIPPLVFGTPPAGSSSSTPAAVNTQIPLNTALGAAAPTSGLSYLFSSKNFALDYIITAAETKGVGKLLSEPKILTQNNKKGIVMQGTKIPIQTIVNNTISVQFIDAVLKLEVTPQITGDGNIMMDVVVENTQIDPAIPRVNGIPALDTQRAESAVLVGDGGTMVLGGIIISAQNTNISQVPLFGSIPLLGNLFKRTTVTTSSQELLFFLTPRIIPI